MDGRISTIWFMLRWIKRNSGTPRIALNVVTSYDRDIRAGQRFYNLPTDTKLKLKT